MAIAVARRKVQAYGLALLTKSSEVADIVPLITDHRLCRVGLPALNYRSPRSVSLKACFILMILSTSSLI